MPDADPEPDLRMRRPARRPLTAFARVLPLVVAVLGLLALLAIGFVATTGAGRGYDFRAYWDAGERLATGGSLYDPATLAGPFRPGPFGLYLYPPPLAVLLLPLQALGYPAAESAWVAARIAAIVAACALLPVPRSVRLAVFGTTALAQPTLVDLNLGNVSIVVFALTAVGWRFLDRPAGSVAIAAAVALRSPLAILLAWQAVRRRWRALAWTIGAGAALIAVSLPFVGIAGYGDYLRVLGNLRDITGVSQNVDLGSTALRLGASPQLATAALIGGYAIAIGSLLLSLRRDAEIGYAVAVSATLLLSPLLWGHYLVLLAIPAALLAARGRPIAVLLPLAAWLPDVALPLLAVIATLAPFAARPATASESTAGSS